jgi:hypothetical protein
MERMMPMQDENKKCTDSTANVTTTKNTFSKKIGRTVYNVQIFFSKTSKEHFNDKLLRLIKNDVTSGAK